MTKAIVLLSGGLDSTVVLALALARGCQCYTLSFDYGQRHHVELKAAEEIAKHYAVPHQLIKIEPILFSRSLLSSSSEKPLYRSKEEIVQGGIPSTYVGARNTLFISYALGFCETYEAQEIHFGANALDRYGYPDCRPAYIEAFQTLMNVATKQAVEGNPPQLVTPLMHWDKTEIIKQGIALQVPLELTMSCYNPIGFQQPCHQCDACLLRKEGFEKAIPKKSFN